MTQETHNTISGGTVDGTVIQVGTLNMTVVDGRPADTDLLAEDPWVSLVAESKVWSRVPDSPLREHAVDFARRLAALRDEANLDDDPWIDHDLVRRFSERVDWLVAVKVKPDLHPAEAVLLALVPLLHQCLWLRAADAYRLVDPSNFASVPAPDDLRASYEGFLRNHDKLVGRATLPELPGRRTALNEIAWWLFHRWLSQRAELLHPTAVTTLLTDLHPALPRPWIRDLLHGLRVDPRWLTGERRLSAPDAVETIFGGTSDEQPLRKHLVALLLGIAHTAAIEVTDLSDVLVWHMGVPRPVEIAPLLRTVREATWHHREDGPVLKASCDHEAVVEALQSHAARLGDLLRAIRLATRFHGLEPLRELPSRATGDFVQPRTDADGNPAFSGWSKFRVDEDRVRDLLMGEQLYQDKHMAIRELYQNALDACRYRQARETYGERAGRPSHWTGEIKFFQGVDDNGRHYLDCTDNGIGMDVPELTGVFAQAGARFATLPEFRDEQLDWRSVVPPVELHPNSRFGIGVLSYFMLADEIEVTTCRMGRDGGPTGPKLQVTISGPGQLFQIRQLADRGLPGTTVRLYLRDSDPDGTSISSLANFLVIADFHTLVQHNDQEWHWPPGIVTRHQGPSRNIDITVSGARIRSRDSKVTWCERGGALLVDGLAVKPIVKKGVLRPHPASITTSHFRGAVVNLTGPMSPKLSVDRTRIIGDVSANVEELLLAAVPCLLSNGASLLQPEWLNAVSRGSLRFADIIVTALIREQVVLNSPQRVIEIARTGWLSLDAQLVDPLSTDDSERNATRLRSPYGTPPDHILLWRLLAFAPDKRLQLLADAAPGVVFPLAETPALPSDEALLTNRNSWRSSHSWERIEQVSRAAGWPEASPEEISRRIATLNLAIPPADVPRTNQLSRPVRWSVSPASATNRTEEILVSKNLDGKQPWLHTGEPVPNLHMVAAFVEHGIPMAVTAEILGKLGFHFEREYRADALHNADPLMLRSGKLADDRPDRAITLYQLILMSEASGRTLQEVADHLRGLGLDVPDVAETIRAAVARLPKRSESLP